MDVKCPLRLGSWVSCFLINFYWTTVALLKLLDLAGSALSSFGLLLQKTISLPWIETDVDFPSLKWPKQAELSSHKPR